MHLGADPVQRERHEPHAALGIEAAHGLHQADVAFLDQVGLRQPVTQVVARDGDHQPQVRQHQLARGVDVVRLPSTARPNAVSCSAVSSGKRFTA